MHSSVGGFQVVTTKRSNYRNNPISCQDYAMRLPKLMGHDFQRFQAMSTRFYYEEKAREYRADLPFPSTCVDNYTNGVGPKS